MLSIVSCTMQLVTTGNPVNSYLTSTVHKTNYGPVIAPFSGKVLICLLNFFQLRLSCPSNQPFLLLLMICCGYAANYNSQRAFVIIFFICSDLLNCLRSGCTVFIATKKWLKQPQGHHH